MSLNITIGADPEFFLRNKKTGSITSAHDIVPGTKVNPHPLKNGGFIQADGTAVEFNIPPAKTGKEFSEYVGQALEDIKEFVDINKFDYVFRPHVKYPKKYFDSLPENVRALGCDPDFNAYTLEQNNIYQPPSGVRTGSGHLHIGFSKDENVKNKNYFLGCAYLVKFLDATLATEEYKWCDDMIRPNLYGDIGNFRPKTYGLEYRTLSNSWLNHPRIWESLFDRTKQTVLTVYEKQDAKILLPVDIIKTLNKKRSKSYSFRFSVNFPLPNIKLI